MTDDVDLWDALRAATPARIGLGRAGASLPTAERLRFQLDHALARDAVAVELDVDRLVADLAPLPCLVVATRAETPAEHLRRPDLGRRLDPASVLLPSGPWDLAIVVAGGLSAGAAQRHAPPVVAATVGPLVAEGWTVAPVVVVPGGRVALGDEVGALLGAALVVVLIGERPGLTAPESLGAYVTVEPRIGRTDAERSCLSNIRPDGLPCGDAAAALVALLRTCRRAQVSGVALGRAAAQAGIPEVRHRPLETGGQVGGGTSPRS